MPISALTIVNRPTTVAPSEEVTYPLLYIDEWDADTNTPSLAGSTGTKGYTYKVSVAGTTSLDGNDIWNVGDYATFNGTTWDRLTGSVTIFEALTAGLITADGSGGIFSQAIEGIIKSDADSVLYAAVAGTDYLSPSVTATITKGFKVTPKDNGTKSSGSWTPDPAEGNVQYVTNNGAFQLNAPANDCEIDIWVTNGAAAGTITLSGFKTPGSGVAGPTYTTTNAQRWMLSIRRINGESAYIWNGPWT